MTFSELKYQHELKNPGSFYFSKGSMSFFGDTIANYGVLTHDDSYELHRKKPVKHGLKNSAFFNKETFTLIH
jgi:hypothetical protein